MMWSTIVFAATPHEALRVAHGQPGFGGKSLLYCGQIPTSVRQFVVKWSHAVDGSVRAIRWWVDHVAPVTVVEATASGERREQVASSLVLERSADPHGPALCFKLDDQQAAVWRRQHGVVPPVPVWLFVASGAR